MRYLLIAIVLVCAICEAQTAGSSSATAQAQGGNSGVVLEGTITDSSGAVLVGATLTATDASGRSKSATTDAQGRFEVRGLSPGFYTISVQAAKFKEYKAENFNIVLDNPNFLEVRMEPAGISTNVNVTGQVAAQVETETAELSGTITARQITTLPPNGRNFSKFITLTPGVSDQTGQDEAKVGVLGSAKYSVNGGRVEYNTWDVDGSDLLNPNIAAGRGHSTYIVYPSLDAIQDIKVLTSNYGAQYGRSASGTVVVSTKSGGAQFHGNLFEFVRNEKFNARGFLDPPGSAPPYRRNDFGFTLGGPLFISKVYNPKKDKTFFFFSEEARIERSPTVGDTNGSFSQAVPSLNEREGNFSDVCPAAPVGSFVTFDRAKYPDCPSPEPPSTKFGSTTYTTFPGNIVPIDPNARGVLLTNLIPLANSKSGCTVKLNVGAVSDDPSTWPCYNVSVSPGTYWREELFRIDHTVSPTLKASFRYIHDAWDTTVTAPQWQYGGVENAFPTVLNRFIGPGLSLVAHLTATAGSSFVNDYSIGYTRQNITLANVAGPGATLTRPSVLDAPCGTAPISCGMGYLFSNSSARKIPAIYLGGSNASLGGRGFVVDTSYMPWNFSNHTISVRDDLTKIIGKHTIQLGMLLDDAQQFEISSATGANTGNVQGLLAFGNVSNLNTTGNTFADFMRPPYSQTNSGEINYFQQDSGQGGYHNHYWIFEPYFQDNWRVFPRLTLNLGLRLSLFGNWTPDSGTVFNFVPAKYDPNLAKSLSVDPATGYLKDATTGQPILINVKNPDSRTINGLVQCGANGIPAGCMTPHIFNPAPRIGFAWDPNGNGKTSIRAGYGIFFEHGTASEANSGSLIGSAPSLLSMTQNGLPFQKFSWQCIGGRGVGCGSLFPAGVAYPLDVVAIPTKTVWPYVQQWSLSVQREVTSRTITTLAYVGSKGTHLTTVRQLNQFNPVDPKNNFFGPSEPVFTATSNANLGVCYYGNLNANGEPVAFITQNGHHYFPGDPAYFNLQIACSSNVVVNSFRKYPGYGRIMSLDNIANSSYNALQLTVNHSARVMNLGLSYTWGHSIDEASDRYESAFGNSLDPRSNRASSNFDQRHILNFRYSYKLPLVEGLQGLVGSGRSRCDPGDTRPECEIPIGPLPQLVVRALKNWELSGITTFQTGIPFSIVNGGSSLVSVLDNAGVANGLGAGSYPDLAKDTTCNTLKASGVGPLLGNPCRFVAPRGLTFGNTGRNFMNNPSRTNFDMVLSRSFSLRGEHSLEFRAESFNVLNSPQYMIYDPNKGNTASNTITCYGDANTGYSAGAPSCLVGSAFLRPVGAHRPRTFQFGAKVTF